MKRLLPLILCLVSLTSFGQVKKINDPQFSGRVIFMHGTIMDGTGLTLVNFPGGGSQLPDPSGHSQQWLFTDGASFFWNPIQFSNITNTPTTLAGYGIVIANNTLTESMTVNLVSDLASKALDSSVVHNTGAENVYGEKTFDTVPQLPAQSPGYFFGVPLTAPGSQTPGFLQLFPTSSNNVFGTTSNRGITKTIYVSPSNTSGGSGTAEDPYDASTAAKLGTIIDNAIPLAPVTIKLAAGLYKLPFKFWTVSGMRIIGSGMDSTIIQNQSNDPAGCLTCPGSYQCTGGGACHPRFTYWNFFGDNNEIKDLQVDAQSSIYTDQTSTDGFVRMYGSNNTITGVWFKNGRSCTSSGNGCSTTVAEAFPLGIAANNGVPNYNGVIQYCMVSNEGGIGGTMIGLNGDDGGTAGVVMTNGHIIGNYVFNCPNAIAFGLGSNRAGIIAYNQADNVQYGGNRDSWESTGNMVIGNSFTHCKQYGMVFRSFGSSTGLTQEDVIESNFLQLTGERSDSTGISAPDTLQTAEIVRNNTVTYMNFVGTTNATTTVSNIASTEFNYLVIGQKLVSTNITSGTTIASINSGAGTITLSAAATGSASVERIQVLPNGSPNEYDLHGGPGWIITGNKAAAGGAINITDPNSNQVISGNMFDDGTPWTQNMGYGALQLRRTQVLDSDYTTKATDYLVSYTSFTGAHTVTLVDKPPKNTQQIIKDETGSVGAAVITVQPTSGTIDGSASKQITTARGFLRVYYNGTNWFTW